MHDLMTYQVHIPTWLLNVSAVLVGIGFYHVMQVLAKAGPLRVVFDLVDQLGKFATSLIVLTCGFGAALLLRFAWTVGGAHCIASRYTGRFFVGSELGLRCQAIYERPLHGLADQVEALCPFYLTPKS